jgi:chromosomal replication initiation ATPase DnaA
MEHVGKAFNIEVKKIQKKGLKRNKAREVAIYLGRELSKLSCNELGDFFGGVSGALITMMNRRITEEIDTNQLLKNKIEKIKDQIFNI